MKVFLAAAAVATTCSSVFVSAASADGTTPEQVHIALAGSSAVGDPNGFTFGWFTEAATQVSSVQVNLTQGVYDTEAFSTVVNGTSEQYLAGHGYHHSARVVNLPQAAKISYRVGSEDGGWSETFSATVAPSKDTDRTIKLSVFGDMGYEDSTLRPMEVVEDGLEKQWSATFSRQTLETLKNNGDIEMIWHVGDIGYADDAFAHDPIQFVYEKAYNGYMNWLQNLTTSMPYMVSVGNHESECHSAVCLAEEKKLAKPLSNFTAYNKRWHMPSVESGGHPGSNMWYSWNYGPVHFVSVNTETDFPGSGEEHTGDSHIKWLPAGGFGYDGEYLAWVEADLKAAAEARDQGTGRPWIVAGGHRPYGDIKDQLEPLFDKYGVDMYVCGHTHSYARSVPATSKSMERHHRGNHFVGAKAPVWITVGGPGCDEMKQGNNVAKPGEASPWGAQAMTYDRYATGILEANRTALYWRLIDSVNGTVIDEITISK